MALQNLGSPPSGPHDYADLTWLAQNYPFTSGRVQSNVNFTVSLPSSPFDHQMYLLEAIAGTTQIVVTIPTGTLLTQGVLSAYTLPPNKTGFFGFRYSAVSQAWFALSATIQQ